MVESVFAGPMRKHAATFFPLFITVVILTSSLPVISEVNASTEENYPYSGSIVNPYSLSGSSEITYSTDGTLIAAAFNSDVVIINAQYRTFITDISIGNKILSLSFSEDDSSLLVGLESPFMSTLAMAIYDTSTWQRIGVNEDGKAVSDISILPGQEIFASANENNGVSEYFINDSTHSISTFDGEHTSDVSCMDHSPNGQQLVTGGEDGNIFLWNRSSMTVDIPWQVGFSIIDCSISPDGTQLAWVTNSLLQVRTVPDGEYITSQNLVGIASQLEWAENGEELWVLIESTTNKLTIFDVTDYSIITSFDLGHKISRFAKSPIVSEFVVTTNTHLISVFREDAWAPYSGLAGADLDGDGTPDRYDGDDDGDGLGDDFEYSCTEGSDCDLHPHPDYIRQVSIKINNNKITIQDTYQLNSSISAPIRELASSAVASDGLVSQGEAIKMEKMLCSGTNANQISLDWNEALKFDNSAIIGTTVRCDAKLGLIGTVQHDSSTRIQLRWFIEITMANNIPRPFNMSFNPSVSPPLHTISQIAPTSPLTLTLIHQGDTVYYQTPIHTSSPQLSIIILAKPAADPSIIDILLSWIESNYLLLLGVIITIGLGVILVVRRKNSMLFEIEEDEENLSITTSRRRSSTKNMPSDNISSTGRPQPIQPPEGVTSHRPQPAHRPSNEPMIRRVKRAPGSVSQSGKAPEGEEWDYSEHGAYWDKDDPDATDPYGEAQEFHKEELAILDIAQQVAAETTDEEIEIESPIQTVIEPDIEGSESDMDAALSIITKPKKVKSKKSTDKSEEVDGKPKKKRRKVKRRKSS
ncbi:MAG TPA: WD40 repeat domain-containing protein [Candidatus Poseidoniales archaeon]|nr:WD40 repeat domain-containing protein [Candidatus Poseidoniales archaeon]